MYTHTGYIYQPSDLQQFWPKSSQVLYGGNNSYIADAKSVPTHTSIRAPSITIQSSSFFFTGVQHLLELGHSHPA
jgi:hypothetical protein